MLHWEESRHEGRTNRAIVPNLASRITGEDVTAAPGRRPQQYVISVRGHLGKTMLSAFPALQAHTRGGDTVLTGTLPDQAALLRAVVQIGLQPAAGRWPAPDDRWCHRRSSHRDDCVAESIRIRRPERCGGVWVGLSL
jgi:hypothetical protein